MQEQLCSRKKMTKLASRRHAGAAFGGSCRGAVNHDLSNGAPGTQDCRCPGTTPASPCSQEETFEQGWGRAGAQLTAGKQGCLFYQGNSRVDGICSDKHTKAVMLLSTLNQFDVHLAALKWLSRDICAHSLPALRQISILPEQAAAHISSSAPPMQPRPWEPPVHQQHPLHRQRSRDTDRGSGRGWREESNAPRLPQCCCTTRVCCW